MVIFFSSLLFLCIHGQSSKDDIAVFNGEKIAAERGQANGQHNLEIDYYTGKGVLKDPTKAAYWFKKAAEQAMDRAQYNLGFMYRNGEGVIKDVRMAVYWYQKAAEQKTVKPPEMVYVQGGTVKMSDNYSVNLSNYYIGKYEVTRGQFAMFVADVNYQTQDDKDGKGWVYDGRGNWTEKVGITWRHNVAGTGSQPEDHPVMRVSWEDAEAYCAWLSRKTGQNYHLPSEAQWQFAAMGGNSSRGYTYSGSNDVDSVAQYEDNNNKSTTSVGTKKANELGIYDMSGNVWEWCRDVYDSYPSGTYTDRIYEGSSSDRVVRGSSWYDGYYGCSPARRTDSTPERVNGHTGFRLSRTE